jgi:hypothetical protein
MRTDIPAFYSKWFVNRLKEGFVLVRNPYNPDSVTKYSLSPKVVDAIAFCTKNPSPMLPYMDLLKPYGQFWFVTITPYGKEVEPNVPPKDKVMEDFKTLSDTVGKNCVGWRYDPVFITKKYSLESHIKNFEDMAKNLSGYTDTCVISFIDMYKKVLRNFPEAREVTKAERIEIGREFVRIGKKYGIKIKSCAEGKDLEAYGVDCGGCMTAETFERAVGAKLNVPKRKCQRSECNCLLGNDIGNYDTCGHLCKYCYANANAELVKSNMKRHNPNSPFLLGDIKKSDKIHEAKQASWLDLQMSLM